MIREWLGFRDLVEDAGTFGTLADQAKEVRALSTQVTADVAKQVKEQVTRGVGELRKAS